jgi:hypothetical protein
VYLIDGYRDRTDMLSLDFASQHLIAMVGATLATLLLTFAVIPANYPLQGSRAVTPARIWSLPAADPRVPAFPLPSTHPAPGAESPPVHRRPGQQRGFSW